LLANIQILATILLLGSRLLAPTPSKAPEVAKFAVPGIGVIFDMYMMSKSATVNPKDAWWLYASLLIPCFTKSILLGLPWKAGPMLKYFSPLFSGTLPLKHTGHCPGRAR
jgi:hypothetical protein